MRRPLLLLCLILLARAAPAAAQTDIHRCIGANGGPVFTDQPCAALHATAVHAAAPSPAPDTAAPEPLPVTCAADVAQLRQGVIDAFARHDANRLAGLMLWNGYGRGAAVADITSLGAMVRHTLLDVQPSGDGGDPPDPAAAAALPSAAAPTPPATPAAAPRVDGLTLQIDGNDDPRGLRFDIVRRAGCLWLRNAD